MSADNGIHIKKSEDNTVWEVYEYSASAEYEDSRSMYLLGTRNSLEEAILFGQFQQTEYGLSFTL